MSGASDMPAAGEPLRARRMQMHRIMATQPSTESYGLGQSGCAAGRRERDPALERDIEASNRSYPRSVDPPTLDWGLDERWTGRGGLPWAPESSADEPEVEAQKIDELEDESREKRSA